MRPASPTNAAEQPSVTTESLGYQPALDGLRAVAIALVLAFHIDRGSRWPWLTGGFLGVDVFFVLSGFLITSLLLDERRRTGAIAMRAFWARRAARLFPLLWALLAFMAFARWIHPIGGVNPPTAAGFAALLAYVGNWLPATGHTGLQQTTYLWSLSVEEQFYVLWPPMVIGLLAAGARRRAHAGALSVFAVSTAIALAVLVLRPTVFQDTDYYFNTFLRADELLVGAALAASRRWWQPHIRPWMATVLAVAGALAIWWAVRHAFVGSRSLPVWRLPLLEAGVLAIVAAVVSWPRTPIARLLAWSPLVLLGRASYALYLIHVPIFRILQYHLGMDRPRLRAGIEVPLAIALAIGLHLWFEVPSQRILRRRLGADRSGDPAAKAASASGLA